MREPTLVCSVLSLSVWYVFGTLQPVWLPQWVFCIAPHAWLAKAKIIFGTCPITIPMHGGVTVELFCTGTATTAPTAVTASTNETGEQWHLYIGIEWNREIGQLWWTLASAHFNCARSGTYNLPCRQQSYLDYCNT